MEAGSVRYLLSLRNPGCRSPNIRYRRAWYPCTSVKESDADEVESVSESDAGEVESVSESDAGRVGARALDPNRGRATPSTPSAVRGIELPNTGIKRGESARYPHL